jgi:hypothetical protein
MILSIRNNPHGTHAQLHETDEDIEEILTMSKSGVVKELARINANSLIPITVGREMFSPEDRVLVGIFKGEERLFARVIPEDKEYLNQNLENALKYGYVYIGEKH